jgi:hypothetical protein
MALSDNITRDVVLQVIGEYNHLGRDGFPDRYGFDRAHPDLLVHDGKRAAEAGLHRLSEAPNAERFAPLLSEPQVN